jgi:hypothetical protein
MYYVTIVHYIAKMIVQDYRLRLALSYHDKYFTDGSVILGKKYN